MNRVFMIVISIVTFTTYNMREVKQIFSLIRHGSRSPTSNLDIYGKDVFKEEWDYIGELTSNGMRMHYILGYLNREHYYKDFFTNLNKKEIEVLTTDKNRTIESAQSYLNGLYPHGTGKEIEENQSLSNLDVPPVLIKDIKDLKDVLKLNSLPKQANSFIIKTFDYSEFYISLHEADYCYGIQKFKKDNLDKRSVDSAKKSVKEKEEDNLKKALKLEALTDSYLGEISDACFVDYFDSREFTYIKPVYDKPLLEKLYPNIREYKEIVEFDKNKDINNSYYIPRISFSKIGKTILSKFDSIDSHKYTLLSVHDDNLSNAINFLSHTFSFSINYNTYYPDYASQINFVLYEEDDKSLTVIVTINQIEMINMKYQSFIDLMNKGIISDKEINDFCEFPKEEQFDNLNFYIIGISILSVLNVITIVLIICWYQKKMDYLEVEYDEEP